MKRSTILAATLLASLAPLAVASPATMKAAQAKNPAIKGFSSQLAMSHSH